MFKLGRSFIKEHCSDFSFDRGLEYHFGNRVRAIQYNPNKSSFTAAVHDLKERNVKVAFDHGGRLINTQCSCRLPDKPSHSFCEHIIAVLLFIEQRDNEGFFSQLKDREKARRIFELFSYKQPDAYDEGAARTETVHLEAIYVLSDTSRAGNEKSLHAFLDGEPLYESFYKSYPERGARFQFRIKSGASSYMIKNIGRFSSAFSKNRPVDFSKKFTFDPSRHLLDDFDRIIGNYLLEILEASTGETKNNVSGSAVNPDVFNDKYLCLTDRQFRRLIDLHAANKHPMHIYENAAIHAAPIIDEGVPIEFRLGREDNDFILKVETGNDLLPLTAEGDIIYKQNTIYRLPAEQAEIMRPFLVLLESYRDNHFRFISEDRSRFISEVLPAIDRVGTLTIDDDVGSLIEKHPIETDIYLDREDGAVSADVRFRYGDIEINPFAASSKTKTENTDGRIIVRDVARENEILDIFAEANFKVKNGKINLTNDDSVFVFIVDILPKLQKYAGIYYSQDFRRMTVKRGLGFRANLSLRDSGGGLSDLLAFDFDTDYIDRDELIEIMRSIREKKRYYKLRDGSLLNIGEREALDVMKLLEIAEAADEDVINGHLTLPRSKALYLDSFIRETELRNIGRDRILREFINTLSEPADSDYSPPECVDHVLRDYQRTGFKWLKALSVYSLGGILADDMGLGKTLQVLVLLLSAREEQEGRAVDAGAAVAGLPSLIVAPTSLIYNWCAEIEKFTPGLRYIAIYGGKAERLRLIGEIPGNDVVITSYPLIRRDYDEYRKLSFHYLILDEAQYIKNPNSQNALSVKCLNANSRFALTGTPIENRLLDLWSIFDFVLPGYLRTAKNFYERYANESPNNGDDADRLLWNQRRRDANFNIGDGPARPAEIRDDTGGRAADDNNNAAGEYNGADEYGADVNGTEANGAEYGNDSAAGNGEFNENDSADENGADDDSIISGEAENDRQYAYNNFDRSNHNGALTELSGLIKPFILRRLKSDVLRELPDKIDSRMYAQMTDGQKKLYLIYHEKIRSQIDSEISANGFEKSQFIILAALTRLRQICCHPALFIEDYKETSGKLLLLEELVREAIGGGHRLLIFSQFTEMLAIIRAWADKEEIEYFYIDGHVKAFDRHRMINAFNSGAGDMFLLSLKAGGAGVNLTGADTVIHYDPWWNPAVEEQATDRAYRIGQQKTVQVIKLLTAGSIEEKIYAIQERKKQLIDAVIRPGETFLTKLSKSDLDEILSL